MYSLKTARYVANPMTEQIVNYESLKKSGMSFPYAEDGLDFYDIVFKFVEGYINIYFTDDSAIHADKSIKRLWLAVRKLPNSGIPSTWNGMNKNEVIKIISHYIFHVTAVHHIVGIYHYIIISH